MKKDVNGWISVIDELPIVPVFCLVILNFGNINKRKSTAQWEGTYFDHLCEVNITHWQPFPDFPIEHKL